MRILVVGSGSYLAREFLARNADLNTHAIGHSQVDEDAHYEGVACVVNFAFAPALQTSEYDAALDVDARAARRAAAHHAHFVMISSRRVYADAAQWNASEKAPLGGIDAYSRNKLRVERNLEALLGARLTVLRPGNVVGYEPMPGRQRFAAYLQNQLLETGRIRLSVDPRVRRDLVPVDFFCRVLRKVLATMPGGVFNVGSGAATRVGDAARWLLEGFGGGELLVEGAGGSEFLLDSSKLARELGLACAPGDLERTLREAGKRLAREKAMPRALD